MDYTANSGLAMQTPSDTVGSNSWEDVITDFHVNIGCLNDCWSLFPGQQSWHRLAKTSLKQRNSVEDFLWKIEKNQPIKFIIMLKELILKYSPQTKAQSLLDSQTVLIAWPLVKSY